MSKDITAENIKKLKELKKTNEKQRTAKSNYCKTNSAKVRSFVELYNGDENVLIEKLSQPKRKLKSRFQMIIEKKIERTGLPFCGVQGITNPIKLNISDETLKKIGDKG